MYHSCIGDNLSDKNYQDSVYSSYSGEHGGFTAEPEPITQEHYEQLRSSLGERSRLGKSAKRLPPQLVLRLILLYSEPPNFRSDAREKLARLTRVQFLELAMDVHDEVARVNSYRAGNVSPSAFVPARPDYPAHRNEARQKIADLRPDLLEELMSDIFYELGRRYPKFKGMGSPEEPPSPFRYTSGPSDLEIAGAWTPSSRVAVDYYALEDNIGKIVRSMTLELNSPPVDIISSSMSITEIILMLGQHGCPNITGTLDVSRCGLGPIAGGGFGDVYQGYLRSGVEVAIKCPRFFLNRNEISQADLKAAARELHTWSKYKHPNVVQLLGVAQFRDRIAMISPWMKNGTLCQYIIRAPNADRCRLCLGIASGVAYLHSMGTVHGDIKGLNVLISHDGTPKLIDFGNSRLNSSTLHFTGLQTASTFSTRWTAPELLIDGGIYSMEADVYALGMTILEVITGRVPFHDLRNDLAVITRVVVQKTHPDRPTDLIPASTRRGDAFWQLLNHCWSFDPLLRPRASQVQTRVVEITREGLRAAHHADDFGRLIPELNSALKIRSK
ncbi:hypothetical protein FRC10_011786 [Ceratobasidium sp. 414]|nr:hypothetical protein FRC10_011786 [Ceratobasidium sp. 414]